jgi:O-antigen/teichoic acid export membrane protein
MITNLKRTIKHSFIISLGKISSKIVGFILLPIYTKEIALDNYGVLGLLEVIELVGVQVISFGLPQALLRWLGLSEDLKERKSIIFTTLIFTLLISIMTLLLVSLFSKELSIILFSKPDYSKYLVYIFISITLINLSKIPQTVLRVEEKTVLYSISIVIQFTSSVLLNIYFVAVLKMGILGILLAYIISGTILVLILLPYLFKRIRLKFDFHIIKGMVSFSYPFILTAISATILQLGDRYILTKLSTLNELGLYSLGYKFSNVVKIFIIDSFFLGLPIIGWQVVRNDDKPKEFFSKIFKYFVFASFWIALLIAVYSKGIIHLFALNKDYWEAYRVIPFLLIGIIFLGIAYFMFFILQIPKKTKNISLILTISAVVNILLNLVAIPRAGMMGAAYVTIISNLIAAGLAYYQAQKYYKVRYEVGRLPILFILGILLYLLSMLFDPFILPLRILLKGVIVIIFPFILYLFGFYQTDEINNIKKILLRR